MSRILALGAGILLLSSADAFSPMSSGISARSLRSGVAMCQASDASAKAQSSASGSGLSMDRRSFSAALGLAVPAGLLSMPSPAEAKKQEAASDGYWAVHTGPFTPKELEGFTTTDNGLQYKTIQAGTGVKPVANSKVKAHYAGYLLADGKKFDASYDRGRPFGFRVGAGQVIKAWDQAFLDMKVGEKRIIIAPPELAYGNKAVGNGLIPAKSTLVFFVELLTLTT